MAKTNAAPVVEPTIEPTPEVNAGNSVNLEGVSAGTSVTLADGTVITNY